MHTCTCITNAVDPVNNDIIHGKALNSLSFILSEFSPIANVKPIPTTYSMGTEGANNLEISNIFTIRKSPKGSQVGAVVIICTCHHCDPGSILGSYVG